MPDGALQRGFGFTAAAVSRLRPGEIVIDFFAGGGGASEALRQALGRDPDIAVNHDAAAIGMHAANHPCARHLTADVWTVDVAREVGTRMVGWFHASPDCTHFSQAKGGQPRKRETRSLSWVVLKVAGVLARRGRAPRIISLENVRQILQWGPLVAKRDFATGRVVRLDGRIAAPGEHTPLDQQFLVPDQRRAGRNWRQFIAALRRLGYAVEWRRLIACDYGAGTSRERLFLIARRDGSPIAWPVPTHGPGCAHPHVTAADCIDWSIPCPSIFGRAKPLADATCRRIVRGIHRYVLGNREPFFLTEFANASGGRCWSVAEPLRTQCAGVKGGHFALVAAFLEQANGGGPNGNPAPARPARAPLSAITASGSQQRLVTAQLQPSPASQAAALRVAAFLVNYYGNGQPRDLRDPLDTITTRDRLALVTVILQGRPYLIVDIGLRMLTPRELYRAQGFPSGYVIERAADGRPLTKRDQVRMVGNSVSPPPLAALVRANLDMEAAREAA